ncbi:MAG: hypothetical protein ACHP84_15600 [Caulobacterales bacterium]
MIKTCLSVLLGVIALTLVGARDAQARWLMAESPQFIVYSDGEEPGLRKFTQNLENYDRVLRLLTGVRAPPSATKFHVYLVAGQSGIQRVDPYMEMDAYGVYFAAPQAVFALAVRNDVSDDQLKGQVIVFHEYTHYFASQYFPAAYPVWYQEGFAEYCSTMTFERDGVHIGAFAPNRTDWLLTSAWMPIEDVIAPRQGKSDTKNPQFYPESWLSAHYLLSDEARKVKLAKYLLALQQGADAKVAFHSAFGVEFDAFQKTLSKYVVSGMPGLILHNIPLPDVPMTVTTLPASADRLLLDHARLQIGAVNDNEKSKFLQQIRDEAAAFPDDPLALRSLGLAETRYGDSAKADAALDRLLAADPRDLEALYLKGLRYIEAGSKDAANRADLYARAQPYLIRAHQVDANSYQALYLFGVSLGGSSSVTPKYVADVLMAAHQLAPQVEDIAVAAAAALINIKDFKTAEIVLERVAYAPHPGALNSTARKMLEQAEAGDAAASAPAASPAK